MTASLLLLLPAAALAQFNPGFTYMTTNGTVTITGYTGSQGSAAIPSSINSFPVTAISSNAFYGGQTLTNVTIPASITNIGSLAFANCHGLQQITVTNNPAYSSVDGVLFNQAQTLLIQYPGVPQ